MATRTKGTAGASRRGKLPVPQGWPASRVEMREIESLTLYDRNPRTHDANQVAQLARSIEEFGFTNPVLISEEGMVLAGHGRLEAAKLCGLSQVPTMTATGWTVEQQRAYVIADNQLALNAGWDATALRLELSDLRDSGFDATLTGLSLGEIGELLSLPQPKMDAAAEWAGMPQYANEDKQAFHQIVCHFKDQAALDAFAKAIGKAATTSTRFLHFPEVEIERLADKRYATDPKA